MSQSIPRLVLAGISSGAGKTTATVAITRALRARGLRVALFKCGPDYLDPTYHARASGATSHNLDGWMMGRDAVLSTFRRQAEGADIALVEGVMGLFDGASPTGDEGSTAEIARWLDAPIALVVDASGMARSLAALVHGFARFDPELHLAAVVCNQVGSRGHLDLLRQAQRQPPVLGGLPRDRENRFPERHLGLRTADEATLPEAQLDRWGALAEEWIALDALLDVARAAPPVPAPRDEHGAGARPRACSIGVAFDEAFHFYYADNLRRLEAAGAELVRFSPLSDNRLPDVDALYFGGGYPELHAERLSENTAMLGAVRAFAERGGPIYAECGGLMVLTEAIRSLDGRVHPMVGLFPAQAVMRERLQALGYVEVETQARTVLGAAGLRFRGHQFRYSELCPAPSATEHAYSIRRRRGGEVTREGYRTANVLASYVHAHWASNPLAAEGLVASAAAHRSGR
jgi:cobyrinic acid a,c-diamide synthase